MAKKTSSIATRYKSVVKREGRIKETKSLHANLEYYNKMVREGFVKPAEFNLAIGMERYHATPEKKG